MATTGSRGWVDQLLERVLPEVAFEVVVTGDEVAGRKPDPEAYVTALERLGTSAADTVAVEDSHEGLAAAKAAGLACVVVTNGYTADHDLAAADLVLDGFGEPGRPARVVADPHGTGCAGVLDVDVLARLLAQAEGRRRRGGKGLRLAEAPSREGGFTPRHGAARVLPGPRRRPNRAFREVLGSVWGRRRPGWGRG